MANSLVPEHDANDSFSDKFCAAWFTAVTAIGQRTWAERHIQLLNDVMKLVQTLPCKADDGDSVGRIGFRQTRCRHVTIPDGFNLQTQQSNKTRSEN